MLSNSEIADRLASLAQLLSTQKENPYKVKAYRRAAARIRTLAESVDELVREEADLTQYEGIGEAIASAIREIVASGTLRKLDTLRAEVAPELAELGDYPRLDPRRVVRVYKKLGIASVTALKEKLDSGNIAEKLGARMEQHIRQGLGEQHGVLLYKADELRAAVEEFLLSRCGVRRVEAVGAYRRRVEVIDELSFLVETDDFPSVIAKMERYGGRTALLHQEGDSARFSLPSGIELALQRVQPANWGTEMILRTGSAAHLRKLGQLTGGSASESEEYGKLGLAYVEPELREGLDDGDRAVPELVTVQDVRGELHAHSTSSDGSHSIEQMAAAARTRGYEYIGITDHSQSLKIARGVSIEDLRKQIGFIDGLNGKLSGVRILKSAEVDILADGSLDYPDELLRELDYTICSIHSRFGLGRTEQTERILRAMDNRYFTILGHATGRVLLTRPGYEVDMDRLVEHARAVACFFEINASPNRLDLSAENARMAGAAGVKIAVNTDAHSTRELGHIRHGIDQARRAGLEKTQVLNCLPWRELERLLRRA